MDRLTLVADGLTTFVASQIQLHCFILCGYPGEIIPDLAVIFDVFWDKAVLDFSIELICRSPKFQLIEEKNDVILNFTIIEKYFVKSVSYKTQKKVPCHK